MKNRVLDLITKMAALNAHAQNLEIEYESKRKGDIYNNTVKSLKSKMTACQQAINDLFITSTKEIIKYNLSYRKPLKNGGSKIIDTTYLLPAHLTTNEIVTYFELINPYKVCYVKPEGKLEIGIPRIQDTGK